MSVSKAEEIVKLTAEQASAMLPDGDVIHTFRQAGFGIIGADRPRDKVLAAFEQFGAELSGPSAARMNHGLAIKDERGWLFIETKPDLTTPGERG